MGPVWEESKNPKCVDCALVLKDFSLTPEGWRDSFGMYICICLLKFHRVFLNFFGIISAFGMFFWDKNWFWSLIGSWPCLRCPSTSRLVSYEAIRRGNDMAMEGVMTKPLWWVLFERPQPVNLCQSMQYSTRDSDGSRKWEVFFLEKTALRGEVLSGTWELFGCDV